MPHAAKTSGHDKHLSQRGLTAFARAARLPGLSGVGTATSDLGTRRFDTRRFDTPRFDTPRFDGWRRGV